MIHGDSCQYKYIFMSVTNSNKRIQRKLNRSINRMRYDISKTFIDSNR